jgi:hypothetical protein
LTFNVARQENFPTLTKVTGKLSTEAIQVVFEELRKKGDYSDDGLRSGSPVVSYYLTSD